MGHSPDCADRMHHGLACWCGYDEDMKNLKEEWLREGFRIARDFAEISEHDGWHRTEPMIDWTVAERVLEAKLTGVYPTEPIGGGNPYYRCVDCKRSDPEISARGHLTWCKYR